jgi:hypothetical protein
MWNFALPVLAMPCGLGVQNAQQGRGVETLTAKAQSSLSMRRNELQDRRGSRLSKGHTLKATTMWRYKNGSMHEENQLSLKQLLGCPRYLGTAGCSRMISPQIQESSHCVSKISSAFAQNFQKGINLPYLSPTGAYSYFVDYLIGAHYRSSLICDSSQTWMIK